MLPMLPLIIVGGLIVVVVWLSCKKENYEHERLGLPSFREGDLCQECIGHCYLKIWAGVVKLQNGKNEKEFCTDRCSLECTVLD